MKTLKHSTLLFVLATLVACGDPAVISTSPSDNSTDVALNSPVTATFSQAMDESTFSTSSFSVSTGDPLVAVAGTVLYSNSTTTFWPTEHFSDFTTFTATLTTDISNEDGESLDKPHTWHFTTGNDLAPGQRVNLASSGDFAILAKSGISTVPTSAITGDIGVSPAAATYITGFSLTADSSDKYSTSSQVDGKVYAADYAVPTPAKMTAAISDLESAFSNGAARAPDETELGAGNIGGMTLSAGVYKWSTGLVIPADITLDGSANDVWIFQIAQDLNMSSGARITLAGGAQPSNIFWQVSGHVDIGTGAHCEGVILGQTAITMQTGSSLNGRMLAQSEVVLDGATVTESD